MCQKGLKLLLAVTAVVSYAIHFSHANSELPTLYDHYAGKKIKSGLSSKKKYFTLNKKNITLYSGAMHYFRIPQEYWRDRLRKLRAAGLNAVETYIPWNLHEPHSNSYDFGSGGSDFQSFLDVAKYLKIAQEEDLLTIVRPGPFICSEWEFGGMPSWLLREKGIKVRTSDEKFMKYVRRYFKRLLKILTPLQFTKGGSIIAFQVENEYGSTKDVKNVDKTYLKDLKKLLVDNGVVEMLCTSDGASLLKWGSIPGVFATINFQDSPESQLHLLKRFQPKKPLMVMEYWSGWFDHWTETHHRRSNEEFSLVLEKIMKFPASVNIYMFHGGTNFGFLNGANIVGSNTDNGGQQPDTNSYDYDAPLTENGDYTDKYFSVRILIETHNEVKTSLPAIPAPTARHAFKAVEISAAMNFSELLENVGEVITSEKLLSMEQLPINDNSGQSYGYVVYRKRNLNIPANSILKIEGRVCDTVMVLINGELKSKVLNNRSDLNHFGYWRAKDSHLHLGNVHYEDATIELIVENWGRSNFGDLDQFNQKKGLWQGNVLLNSDILLYWDIIPLEFQKSWTNSLRGWRGASFNTGPALYKALFLVNEPKDTYIDMRGWTKGFVIVNGFVLSRHLRLGPQQSAYLPAPLLNVGINEIIIFEHFRPDSMIQFSDKPIYETLD